MSERDPIDSIAERELRIAVKAVRLYAETHPRPTQVTRRQAAEMLGKSERTVRTYIRARLLKPNRAGLLPIEDVDALRSAE